MPRRPTDRYAADRAYCQRWTLYLLYVIDTVYDIIYIYIYIYVYYIYIYIYII